MTNLNLKFFIGLIFLLQVFVSTFSILQHSKLTIAKENERFSFLSNSFDAILVRLKRDRSTSTCPSACKCQIDGNESKSVKCIGTTKSFVPDTLPRDATSVDLSYNSIQKIEARPLEELSRVKRLDLSYNKIKSIEENSFQDMFRLQWLDLSHNPLTHIAVSDLSEARRSLVTLNISYTGLSALPDFNRDHRMALNNLKRLVAGHNNLTVLKAENFPKTLTHLDLSCLRVVELSGKSFQHLQDLNELVIRGCAPQKSIKAVVDGAFENLESLRFLDLSGNSIKAIPRGLPESLNYLYLSDNQISKIKTSSCANQEAILKYYRVHANLEEDDTGGTVGSDLTHLSYLMELNLSQNPLSSLCSDDFLLLQQLKVLNLTRCKIRKFDYEAFLYAQSLRVLDLSNNFIRHFRISDLPDLEELYVQRNFIVNIEGVTKLQLPSLREADFSYNQFTCDCKLENFVRFLATAYSEKVRFRHLSATSTGYVCFKPPNLRDQPLMSLNINSAEFCGEPGPLIPWPAIAAPLSIAVIFIAILVMLLIERRRSGKSACCACKEDKNESKKKVTAIKCDDDSDIEIQNDSLNDLAILSHEMNQTWVMNSLIPKLRHSETEVQSGNSGQTQTKENPRSLKIEVFSIGKTIQIDTLHRCIDVNRKIALIVTHEFLKEESCRYILKVIQERLSADPEDAVICILLDLIPQHKVPSSLQALMTEKTFLQFPEKERKRQEFYFWENLNSLIFTSNPKSQRPWHPQERQKMTSFRHQQKYSEETLNSGSGTIRSTRRAASRSGDNDRTNFSSAREAHLHRLGINSKEEDVLPKVIKEQNKQKDFTQNQRSDLQWSTINQESKPWKNDDAIQRDIDDIYTTKKDIPMFETNRSSRGGLHSLLPADCGDADSIYSEDGNRTLSRKVVRPADRHRSRNPEPEKLETFFSLEETKQEQRKKSDVMENLHGVALEKPIVFENVNNQDVVACTTDENTPEEKPTKKKPNPLNRLKFLF